MRSFLRSLLVTSTSGLSQEEGLFLGFDVKKVAGGLERRLGWSILGVAGRKLQRQEEGACLEITARMLAGCWPAVSTAPSSLLLVSTHRLLQSTPLQRSLPGHVATFPSSLWVLG